MTLDEKIEYSINLLRKSEEMALRMDPENGFFWWERLSGPLSPCRTGGGEIQGSHEPYERGPT